ncbi:MAG: hypothetical protein KDJ50_08000 [Alphaproteobacteria bacterium]|nr:hypothetical protein [Alphaproteobacteria bacterium]
MLARFFPNAPIGQRDHILDIYLKGCIISASMEAIVDQLLSTIGEQYIVSVRTMTASLDRLNLLIEDFEKSLDQIDFDKLKAEFPEHELPIDKMKLCFYHFVEGFEKFKESFQLAYYDLLECCPTQNIPCLDDDKNEYLQKIHFAENLLKDGLVSKEDAEKSEAISAILATLNTLLDQCHVIEAFLADSFAELIELIPGCESLFSSNNDDVRQKYMARLIRQIEEITNVPKRDLSYTNIQGILPKAAPCQPT